MDDDTLFYLLLSSYCMLWFSICFLLWKKEQRIKDSSTEKIIGKVIGYTISRNLHAPKVAYFVDGSSLERRQEGLVSSQTRCQALRRLLRDGGEAGGAGLGTVRLGPDGRSGGRRRQGREGRHGL